MPGRRVDPRPTLGKGAPDAGLYTPNHGYNSMKPVAPRFSVGNQKRDGELGLYADVPGPLAYRPNDSLSKTHFASWR